MFVDRKTKINIVFAFGVLVAGIFSIWLIFFSGYGVRISIRAKQEFVDWPVVCSMILDGRKDEEIIEIIARNPALSAEVALNGETPLHRAVMERRSGLVDILIKNGADVNARIEAENANEGFTPLHYAAAVGCARCAELLIAAQANIFLVDRNGQDASQIAKDRNNTEVMKIIESAK